MNKKKVKVLQLGSPSGLYGAERWILSLVKYLDPEKIESHIGSISDDSVVEVPVCVEAARLGFQTHVIEAAGKFNLSSVRKLRYLIECLGIDILHTHGYKTDLIGRLATIGTTCKIVTTPHGWTNQPGLKLWIYEALDRAVFPFFDAVAPLSEGILEPLRRLPGLNRKLHLIINGVDIDEIEKSTVISSDISSLKSKGSFIVGYIGRIVPGKGLDVLLSALARNSDSHWEVVIVGEGELMAEMEEMSENLGIESKAHFFGFRPDRLAYLKGFDVFVLPSRSEGIPRCIMEAMTAGIPVIASDIPGCRNLVDGKNTGMLFEVDNSEDLARSIRLMETDHEMRNRLITSGQAFIRDNYSAARMARQYEALFFAMLDN